MSSSDKQQNILSQIQEKIGTRSFAALYSVAHCSTEKKEHKTLFLIKVPASHFKSKIEEHLVFLQKLVRTEGFDDVSIVIDKNVNHAESSLELTQSTKHKSEKKPVLVSDALPTDMAKNNIQEKKLFKKNPLTFETFVKGPTNDFALSTAIAVAENIGVAYNPCLIYGPVGLGKTHLLKAIGHHVSSQNPNAKVLYMSSEQLLNAFTSAIRNNKMSVFQSLTRTQDVILIDDIQFFSGKEGFQEEMFHIFNVLSIEEKQMVFASDRPITKIKDLQDRLASRFKSGISADLQPPTMEMAISIMENYLERTKTQTLVSRENIFFIAEHVRNNTRDMLGFLIRVVEYSKMTKNIVSTDDLKRWVQDVKPKTSLLDATKILQTTARHFTINMEELKSKKRNRNLSHARHIAMYLIRKHSNLSFTEIGKFFGVSHVAVTRAYSNVEADLALGNDISDEIAIVETSLWS